MADHTNKDPGPGTNLPVFSLLAAVAFLALGVAALIFVDASRMPQVLILIGLVASTIPSLIASAYAERTNRDLRNGVVEAKVKSGVKDALVEHQVVTRDGPYVAASTQALLEILQQRHGDSTDTTVPEPSPLSSEDIP